VKVTDELLDLVDRKDRVIGQKSRFEFYAKGLSNFRVINAFLINDQRMLWIPRRSAEKALFPLCLDASVGGHVKSGENYEDTLKRETKEELNLDIDLLVWQKLGHLSPYRDDMSAFMKVYEIRTNVTPIDNSDDFVESLWLNPKKLMGLIQNGEKAKDDLAKLIRIFYLD